MTKFIRGASKGLASYGEASGFILRHKLTGYLLLPGLISLVLAVILLSGAWWLASWLGEGAAEWANFDIPFLKQAIYWTVMVGIGAGAIFLFFYTHKQLVLIALAPFLSILASKTLLIEEQRKEKGGGAVKDLVRSVRVNRRYLTRELLLSLGLLLLGVLVPVLGTLFATVGVFLVQAKYAGNGLVDYALELKRFPVKNSYQFAKERRGLCAGLGAGYVFLMMIPVVGWALAPGLGTVAGTLLASREIRSGGQALPGVVSATGQAGPPPLP